MSINSSEDTIRALAYTLWEQAGRPEGRHKEHWRQAAAELADGQQPRHESVEVHGLEDAPAAARAKPVAIAKAGGR